METEKFEKSFTPSMAPSILNVALGDPSYRNSPVKPSSVSNILNVIKILFESLTPSFISHKSLDDLIFRV